MNNFIYVAIFFLGILSLVTSWILGVRNNEVHIFFTKLLEIVSLKAKEDIAKNLPWEWRYKALDSVSYNKMVLKFWKKPEDFYPDKTFLQ